MKYGSSSVKLGLLLDDGRNAFVTFDQKRLPKQHADSLNFDSEIGSNPFFFPLNS